MSRRDERRAAARRPGSCGIDPNGGAETGPRRSPAGPTGSRAQPRPPRRRLRAPFLLAFALQALVSLGALAAPAPPLCDGSAILTPIGIDTATGTTLLSLAAGGDSGKRWIVELDGAAVGAKVYPDDLPGRYSGSVGRGKVLSVAPCGPSCLQPLLWEGGEWKNLGEPLPAPASFSAAGTYDLAGAPWLLLRRSGTGADGSRVLGYRLEHGDWIHRGTMDVVAVGEPPAHAVAGQPDTVAFGSALLSASGPAKAWLQGMPTVSAERKGSVVRLGESDGAYLAADGVLYRTTDAGKRWQRTTWAPGGREGLVGSWSQSLDFSVDLPYGAQGKTLDLVWFDRRGSAEERLYLTRMTPPDRWETLADLPAAVKTKGPEPFPAALIVKPGDDRWLILFGCANTAEGSGLVVRTLSGKDLSAAKWVGLR